MIRLLLVVALIGMGLPMAEARDCRQPAPSAPHATQHAEACACCAVAAETCCAAPENQPPAQPASNAGQHSQQALLDAILPHLPLLALLPAPSAIRFPQPQSHSLCPPALHSRLSVLCVRMV